MILGYCVSRRLTTSKGILIRSTGVVRYLDAARLPNGIVVEVDIGALIEAMMRGSLGRWGDVVVNVCKAVLASVLTLSRHIIDWLTASGATPRPVVEALCSVSGLSVRLPRYLTSPQCGV